MTKFCWRYMASIVSDNVIPVLYYWRLPSYLNASPVYLKLGLQTPHCKGFPWKSRYLKAKWAMRRAPSHAGATFSPFFMKHW